MSITEIAAGTSTAGNLYSELCRYCELPNDNRAESDKCSKCKNEDAFYKAMEKEIARFKAVL